jgi:tRNA CCA-adding enzyme
LGELISEQFTKSILAEITPTDEEIVQQKAAITELTDALKTYGNKEGFKYSRIQAEGSTGRKQTQLRGASDLDIFVVLNPTHNEMVQKEDPKVKTPIVDELMDGLVEDWFKPAMAILDPADLQKTYSQHPYLSLTYSGFDVDIVGCFELSAQELARSGPISAMDRTIHHSEYVALHLDDVKRNDVRILKSFVRANHAYADTCAVGRMGFTGYALELLIINTGGLLPAFKAIAGLESAPLDPKGRAISELREIPAFRDDYVFIIDPTDPSRNVASSFDGRSYRLLKLLSSKFLKAIEDKEQERVKDLILEQPIAITELPKWFSNSTLVYEFESDGSIHYTVLRDKLYRLGRQVVSQLSREPTGEKRFGDAIFEVFFEKEIYGLGFLVESMKIPESFPSRGPPLELSDAVKTFQKSHSKTFEENGYVWATRYRSQTSAEEVVRDFIASHEIGGLELKTDLGSVSTKLLQIMFEYVLPAEPEFPAELMKESINDANKPKV